MKYLVGVKEVWEQMYEVEADSPEEASQKVENSLMYGDVEGPEVTILEDSFELNQTLDKDEWSVYDK